MEGEEGVREFAAATARSTISRWSYSSIISSSIIISSCRVPKLSGIHSQDVTFSQSNTMLFVMWRVIHLVLWMDSVWLVVTKSIMQMMCEMRTKGYIGRKEMGRNIVHVNSRIMWAKLWMYNGIMNKQMRRRTYTSSGGGMTISSSGICCCVGWMKHTYKWPKWDHTIITFIQP